MEDESWEGFLNIIGLTDEEKKFAKLEEFKQLHNEQPSDSLLYELSNNIYGDLVDEVYLLWFVVYVPKTHLCRSSAMDRLSSCN